MVEIVNIAFSRFCIFIAVLCFSAQVLSQSASDPVSVRTAEDLIEFYLPAESEGAEAPATRSLGGNRGIAGVRKGKSQNETPDEAAQSGQLDFQNIVFDSGSFLVPSSSYRQLDEIGIALSTLVNRFPDMTFVIEGHTDSLGGTKFNQELAYNRAKAIKLFLVAEHSINSEKLTAVGIGEIEPIASNSSTESRAKNRRVSIISRQ